MSPSFTPSVSAVFGLISTQLLHIADVIGSGSSCSQGRCASEPSRNCSDVIRQEVIRILAGVAVEGGGRRTSRAPVSRPPVRRCGPAQVPPSASAARPTSRPASARRTRRPRRCASKRRLDHLVERLPRQVERLLQLAARRRAGHRPSRASGTAASSPVRRRWRRRSIEPDSGSASAHDSRNE